MDLFTSAEEAGTYERPPRPPYRIPSMADINARYGWRGLTSVSTFSGCGGSSLGFRMGGWRVPVAVEFVDAAADSYAANSPRGIVLRTDIRKVSGEELLEHAGVVQGDLDCFEGSPPCASFSSAGSGAKDWGKRKKYSDTEQRTDDLFFEYVRLIEETRPRTFIAENVPGLIRGRALGEYAYVISRKMGELGYRVGARVLNAANYGVPQERERLIFIGIRNDLGVHPSFPRWTTPEPYTIQDALESVDDDLMAHIEESSMEGKAVGRTWSTIVAARLVGLPDPDFVRLPCQRCQLPLDQHRAIEATSTGAITKARCLDGEKAQILKDYFMLTVPRLDRPSPTVTATGAQTGAASVTHPTECRKMTPAELRAVCSFPADFVLTGTREQQCERMGRAVPPLMYKAVSEHLASLIVCPECGKPNGRYDGGDVCEACVMRSFEEAG